MNKADKILITGGNGLVGRSIVRELQRKGYENLLYPSSREVDLTYDTSRDYIIQNRPRYIFHAAALVGGIKRNINQPADFGMLNSKINNNVIEAAYTINAKMLFLGSSCIFPRNCPQPMKEEYLLSGPCEPTNEMYALSKIYGIKLCQAYNKQHGTNFISCQPSNVYGIYDHFDLENAHVVGALINRFHTAKVNNDPVVVLWGDGSARRELIFVDDVANACIFLMNNYNSDDLINVGTGVDHSIKEIAEMIKDVVDYKGEIKWDVSKPSGMPRKVVDVSKINELGWKYQTDLREGILITYKWFLANVVK